MLHVIVAQGQTVVEDTILGNFMLSLVMIKYAVLAFLALYAILAPLALYAVLASLVWLGKTICRRDEYTQSARKKETHPTQCDNHNGHWDRRKSPTKWCASEANTFLRSSP